MRTAACRQMVLFSSRNNWQQSVTFCTYVYIQLQESTWNLEDAQKSNVRIYMIYNFLNNFLKNKLHNCAMQWWICTFLAMSLERIYGRPSIAYVYEYTLYARCTCNIILLVSFTRRVMIRSVRAYVRTRRDYEGHATRIYACTSSHYLIFAALRRASGI